MRELKGGGISWAFWRKIQFEGPQGHTGDDLETIKYTSTDIKEGPRLESRYRNHQLIGAKESHKTL